MSRGQCGREIGKVKANSEKMILFNMRKCESLKMSKAVRGIAKVERLSFNG